MSLSTPVAFIIFNRPDTTAKVFEAIRQAKPQKLLVVADGARNDRSNEAEKCAAARAVIDRVDWECEVLTNYSDINLGCKRRVSSGIDWVFSQVEEAIILEDDCLPAPSFFQFCETLLKKYRHDERIMMISGDNFYPEDDRVKDSYYFSKYVHIWGWATWRRAWQHYDVDMSSWQDFRDRGLLNAVCNDSIEAEYWLKTFNNVAENLVDTWDHQWVYTCWQQSGLSIMPSVNLISNIGFRDDATHTLGTSPLANLKVGSIHNIIHPNFVVRNYYVDTYEFENVFDGKALRFDKTIYGRAVQLARKLKRAAMNKSLNPEK
jgi:hypothetical protein